MSDRLGDLILITARLRVFLQICGDLVEREAAYDKQSLDAYASAVREIISVHHLVHDLSDSVDCQHDSRMLIEAGMRTSKKWLVNAWETCRVRTGPPTIRLVNCRHALSLAESAAGFWHHPLWHEPVHGTSNFEMRLPDSRRQRQFEEAAFGLEASLKRAAMPEGEEFGHLFVHPIYIMYSIASIGRDARAFERNYWRLVEDFREYRRYNCDSCRISTGWVTALSDLVDTWSPMAYFTAAADDSSVEAISKSNF